MKANKKLKEGKKLKTKQYLQIISTQQIKTGKYRVKRRAKYILHTVANSHTLAI